MITQHPTRDDIYIDKIITPQNRIQDDDKIIINKILKKELRSWMRNLGCEA